MWRSLLPLLIAVLPAAELPLRPRWKAGDEFVVEVLRTREDSRRPQANGSSATPVTIRVLETSERGSLVEWTPGPTAFSKPEAAKDPVVGRSMEILKGLRFELILDADGNFAALRNEAPVVARMERVLDGILRPLASDPQLESTMRKALAPGNMVASAAREPQMYFAFGGIEIRKGFLGEAPIEPPNPFGGEPLKAVTRVTVTALDAVSVTATIATHYEPESLRAMTMSLFQQPGLSLPSAQLSEIPSIRMTDEMEGASDLALGIPSQLRVTRRVAMGTHLNRLDEWRMRLVKRPR